MRLPLGISWWWIIAALVVGGIGKLYLRWFQSKDPAAYQKIETMVHDQAATRYRERAHLDVDAGGRPDWRLDVLFGLILIGLAAAAWANGFAFGPLQKGPGRVFISLLVGFLGLLIFVSCFFPNHSYVLKGLRSIGYWGIKGRWQSILLGSVLMFSGILSLLAALGLLWK